MIYNYVIEITGNADAVATGDWTDIVEYSTDNRRNWAELSEVVLDYAARNGITTREAADVYVVRVYENGLIIEDWATEDSVYADYDEVESEDLSDVFDSLGVNYERDYSY